MAPIPEKNSDWSSLFRANGSIPGWMQYGTYVLWALLFVGWWALFRPAVMPSFGDIIGSFEPLVKRHNLIGNWLSTVGLSLEAMAWSCLIATIISYLAVIPLFRPIAYAISKMRYMSFVGFAFLFMVALREPALIRVSLLIYGIVPFLVTSMTAIILSRDQMMFRYARTLNLSEARVVWHVLVRGVASDMLEAIRQNLAIAFVMIVTVEAKIRQGGGLGMLLYDVETRRADYAEVFAIQILIFATAIGFDVLIMLANRWLFPYAFLQRERSA